MLQEARGLERVCKHRGNSLGRPDVLQLFPQILWQAGSPDILGKACQRSVSILLWRPSTVWLCARLHLHFASIIDGVASLPAHGLHWSPRRMLWTPHAFRVPLGVPLDRHAFPQVCARSGGSSSSCQRPQCLCVVFKTNPLSIEFQLPCILASLDCLRSSCSQDALRIIHMHSASLRCQRHVS